MDIATIGVSVLCRIGEGEIFADLRIGLGVAGPVPMRCPEAEAYGIGKVANGKVLQEIGQLALGCGKSQDILAASKEFREQLIVELCQTGPEGGRDQSRRGGNCLKK